MSGTGAVCYDVLHGHGDDAFLCSGRAPLPLPLPRRMYKRTTREMLASSNTAVLVTFVIYKKRWLSGVRVKACFPQYPKPVHSPVTPAAPRVHGSQVQSGVPCCSHHGNRRSLARRSRAASHRWGWCAVPYSETSDPYVPHLYTPEIRQRALSWGWQRQAQDQRVLAGSTLPPHAAAALQTVMCTWSATRVSTPVKLHRVCLLYRACT